MTVRKTWRCFHCDDVFTNVTHAAAHFGIDQMQQPGCVKVLRNGENYLLDRIFTLQQELKRFYDEDSDIMRWRAAKSIQHSHELRSEEERGYNKGVRDMTKERDAERERAEKLEIALRHKDEAMGELFKRLEKANVDFSDLIS